jgi:GDP-L-fucose synthase
VDKNARIYVAGHTGLVGSALLRRLQAGGYSSLITRTHAEVDLERQVAVETLFAEERPEYVFLAAAKVGGIWANFTYPGAFIYSNLAIQTNVVHTAWKTGVKRLLFLGSSCIYPRECPQPMKEEYLLTSPLEPTNEPYAIAKIAGIQLCQSYNRQYETKFLAVMPTNLYGPNDNFDLETSHVLPALLRKLHLSKLATHGNWEGIQEDENRYGRISNDFMANLVAISKAHGYKPPLLAPRYASTGKPAVTLWGSGRARREFLHVDDLANACVFLMSLEEQSFSSVLMANRTPIINIGSGQDQTIRELVEVVFAALGYHGETFWDSAKPDGTPQKLLDISTIRGFGWAPTISLSEGIRQTYDWYLKGS